MGMWDVEADKDHCHVSLCWMTAKGVLDVKDATIQDVHGLSRLNKQLLKQRGAVGEPVHRFHEASKNLISMASVVSNIKTLSDKTDGDLALTDSISVGELVQKFEQMNDPLYKVIAAFVKYIRESK